MMMRQSRSSRVGVLLVLAPVLAAFVLLAARNADAAVKPRPWQWTPAQASGQILSWQPAAFPDTYGLTDGKITMARCAGRGVEVRGRYTSFRCAVVYTSRRGIGQNELLWVKVRRQGAGQPCVSREGLAAVAAPCLNPIGIRTKGSVNDATTAMRLEIARRQGTSFPYQGPSGCAGWGAGFYTCWFGSDDPTAPTNGRATVTMLASGSRVSVLSMPTG